MLGAYAVGKTSLVSRFVKDRYSERYKTTVGVRIDRKDIRVSDRDVRLLLWDLHGEDEHQRVKGSYLRGAAGCLLVVDGTRRNTLETALRLETWARGIVGDIPFGLIVNKVDLAAEWELELSQIEAMGSHASMIVPTSARTGDGVERAYVELARRMLGA